MRHYIIISILFITLTAGLAIAGDIGHGISSSEGTQAPQIQDKSTVVEGWNLEIPFFAESTYNTNCFAFLYLPGVSFDLSRIEFIAGGATGTASIELRADSGSGFPDGPILGSGDFEMVAEVGWQGVELDAPVSLVEGETYYIVYQPIVDSYASLVDPDDAPPGVTIEVIPFYFSDNCPNWEGPHELFLWVARFCQGEGVNAQRVTWDTVKAVYR